MLIFSLHSKGLFTWSGGPRSSRVGFFCFHALGDTKQKKLTPLDRGPPLHVNRVLGPVYMEWGTPVWWGWFLLFSRSGGHKTKETYPTRSGSPTPCKQGLRSNEECMAPPWSEAGPNLVPMFVVLRSEVIFRFVRSVF